MANTKLQLKNNIQILYNIQHWLFLQKRRVSYIKTASPTLVGGCPSPPLLFLPLLPSRALPVGKGGSHHGAERGKGRQEIPVPVRERREGRGAWQTPTP